MINSKYTFYLFLMIALCLMSCGEKKITTHYDSGRVHEVYQYEGDSIKNGWYKAYSETGVLLEMSNYAHGKLEGERILYNHQSGVKEISEIYQNDQLNGRYIVFHANGEIQSLGMYQNNMLSGKVKFYDTSGILKDEFLFVNNFEIIPFKEYHENGKVKWEGTKRYDHYLGLKKDYGELKEYDEDGNLIRKLMCDENEVCTTIWSIEKPNSK